jgi:hypothetical protein
MEVGNVSMMVEINGDPYAVALPQEKLRILIKMAEGLSDSGQLPVKKLGDEYKIELLDA